MTDRLYYDNAYLTEFDAVVLEAKEENGENLVRLDRSAFYPTSGGQPFDVGTLNEANVLDVFVDKEGEVWHKTDRKLEKGRAVHGKIDWQRRFDHMQQHAGEHMLANAAYRLLGGHTIGLHLGRDFSTIDMDLPGGKTHITIEEIRALEDDVNRNIQKNVPIRCYFPDEETLLSLPLRKPPTVTEHVRIVQIGDYEYCACGGTHPENAGEIGLVKILSATPSRGKLRLAFVCGMRAYIEMRQRFEEIERAANALSTAWENLSSQVEALLEKAKNAEYQLRQEKKNAALMKAGELYENAEEVNGVRVIKHVFASLGMEGLREAGNRIIENGNAVALLADEGEKGYMLFFARSENVDANMGKILSESAKKHGGKGGGRSDFAQGSSPDAGVLDDAMKLLFS
ncbi:MAG: hypothetical protein IJB25_03100 [Clostridia bacterium]|nr:hypothetical protein [Clostridia bacterium]